MNVPQPIRLLVVEDEPSQRRLFSLILERLGVVFIMAESGERALELALETPFGLILMDISLPGTDGLQATRALRDKGYEGPIVAQTGKSFCFRDCELAGCDGLLEKPVNRTKLVGALRKYGLI